MTGFATPTFHARNNANLLRGIDFYWSPLRSRYAPIRQVFPSLTSVVLPQNRLLEER